MCPCDMVAHMPTHGRQFTETTLTRFTLCEQHANNINCICLAEFDYGSDDKHQLGKALAGFVVGCVAHLVCGRFYVVVFCHT